MTQTRTGSGAHGPAPAALGSDVDGRGKGRIVTGAATIAALVVLWLLAARWVWDTQVPADLRLPHLDEADYFSASTLRRTTDYGRFVDVLWLVSTLAGLAALAAIALRGRSLARRIGIGRVGTGVVLATLVASVSSAVALPFAIASTWWNRRHGLSRVAYADVVADAWTALIAQTLLLALIATVIIAFAAWLGRLWWVGAGATFVALVALLTFVSPYLMLHEHPLKQRALRADVRTLERATGTEGTPLRVESVHEQTTRANAFSIGFGPSRRVVFWDTILRFPNREVRVVAAHELGHVARGHLWKGIVWFALFAVPLLALLGELMRRRGGLANPATLPAALLVASVLALLLMPAANVVSRRYESEADWVALRTTRDAPAARSLFERFATKDLAEPNPSTLDYLFLENHPTIMQRIAMTKAWAKRHRGAR